MWPFCLPKPFTSVTVIPCMPACVRLSFTSSSLKCLSAAPELFEEHQEKIEKIAKLFSYSQFLADYSIKNPKPLFEALQNLYIPMSKQIILSEVYGKYEVFTKAPSYVLRNEAIELLRRIKKGFLLRITLKDTCGITNLSECMAELSILSEGMIELALILSSVFMREKFGDLKDDTFSIIGLGKLGAGELN